MHEPYKLDLPKPDLERPAKAITMVEAMSEESATGYTHHFPEDLPARTQPLPTVGGWKGRLRSRFWRFSLSSYDIVHTHDGQVRLRHISMIVILVLRAAMSALSILSAIIKHNVAAIIVYSMLAVLSFWFTATCLAIIGDAAGDIRVTGRIIVSFYRPEQFPEATLSLANYRAIRNAGTSMPSSDSAWPYTRCSSCSSSSV
jgi:hypothetical protein